MVSAPKTTIKRARSLRGEMSLPEVLLWNILRQRPHGIKFRRQHPVGPYILDFYCLEKRIAIEIDGQSHNRGNRPERDAIRDLWLAEHRVHVVHVAAVEVLADVERAAQAMIDMLAD